MLEALTDLPVTVIAATAGTDTPPRMLGPMCILPIISPAREAAARAKLVICNGGSPASQQALAAGVPVLGISSNMDQFLNMGAVVQAGAGILLRADRLDAGSSSQGCDRNSRSPTIS